MVRCRTADFSIHLCLDTFAGSHVELIGVEDRDSPLSGAGYDGFPQGMLAFYFGRSGHGKQCLFVKAAAKGDDVADLQTAISKGASFVKGDGVYSAHLFQRSPDLMMTPCLVA